MKLTTDHLVLLDDIIVYSRAFYEYVEGLWVALDCLRGTNLKIKLENANLGYRIIKDFGEHRWQARDLTWPWESEGGMGISSIIDGRERFK